MIPNRYRYSSLFFAVLLLLCGTYGVSAARAADSVKIDITGSEFRMQPDNVTVRIGQPVVIIFHNRGVLSHNLVIDALGLKTKTIHTGETTRISFTPQKSGSYAFRCSVPGHTEAGMRGTLVVR